MLTIKTEANIETHTIWQIQCKPEYFLDDIAQRDWHAIGVWGVAVPHYLDDETAAAAVLGAFHMTVPIREVSGFEFIVYNPDGDEVSINYALDVCALTEEHDVFLVEDEWRLD